MVLLCSYNVYKWLVGHFFLEKIGRNVSTVRTVLHELAPALFIWEPYAGIVDTLPDYCLVGRRVWRYHDPIICVHIVETHLPDRVAR